MPQVNLGVTELTLNYNVKYEVLSFHSASEEVGRYVLLIKSFLTSQSELTMSLIQFLLLE